MLLGLAGRGGCPPRVRAEGDLGRGVWCGRVMQHKVDASLDNLFLTTGHLLVDLGFLISRFPDFICFFVNVHCLDLGFLISRFPDFISFL